MTNTQIQTCRLALLVSVVVMQSVLFAQHDDVAGIHVGPGTNLTVGPATQVTIAGGDLEVAAGGLLVNEGEVFVGRDLLVDGTLHTTLLGDDLQPEHGFIHVQGDAEYRGQLTVGLGQGVRFAEPQDFAIVGYGAGFGSLTPERLPGEEWSASHRVQELVVSLSAKHVTPAVLAAPVTRPGMATTQSTLGELSVFPNPVTDTELHLRGIDRTRQLQAVRLYSQVGKLVSEYSPSQVDEQLALPAGLAAGTYTMQVLYEQGELQTVQVVVVR